jgi:hypothetical protein
MRVRSMIHGAALAALMSGAQSLAAQVRSGRPAADDVSRAAPGDAEARAMLGLAVATSGIDRDTLGLLVSVVIPGGPADQAGIDEGNRLAEINGVSLRVAPANVGQRDAEDTVLRRLVRELRAMHAGDEVTLRVFGGGRYRTATVRTASAPGLVVPPATVADDRAPSRQTTLAEVIDEMGRLQTQLRRLAQDEGSGGRSLGETLVPGIQFTPVADELASYFGEGSERGLLVLQADQSWDPIRTGDVILRIDGASATADRLRAVVSSRGRSRVDVLRRKRPLSVTLDARG